MKPNDFDALFAKLDETGRNCCALLNAAIPTRDARWIASGASAQYPFGDRHHCAIELDAMQKEGKPYIRVRVTTYAQNLSVREAHGFAGLYALVINLADAIVRHVADAGFAEP